MSGIAAGMDVTSSSFGRGMMAVAFILGGVGATGVHAALLTVTGYESATNTVNRNDSAAGPISIRREGVATYFANNRTYTDVAGFTATADFGINKVTGYGSSQAFSVTGSSSSQWADELTLTSSNTNGFLRVLLDISGDLDVTTGSQGNYRYELSSSNPRGFGEPFRLVSTLDSFGYETTVTGYESLADVYAGPSSRRQATVLIPYLSGQRLSLVSNLSCSTATGRTSDVANVATCDAGQSAYWGGILGVIDQDGNGVQGWTLTSASGTDYRRSFVSISGVPESGTWAMMIVGFGAIGSTIRRSRSARLLVEAA